jgi:predicted RNA-binding Zn-ribbon protein involved in translation (DUF1610 family)
MPPSMPPLPGDGSAPADVRPPEVTSAPPPGRKFPCQKCGARLDFDPSSKALKCPYCGHTQRIEPGAGRLQKHDLEEALAHLSSEQSTIEGRSSQATCTTCGAVVLVEDRVAADKCPYCGTFLENRTEAAREMILPEGVLPFAVGDRQAVEAFDRWLKSLWFAPNELRKLANLGRLNGIYVPFWMFDSMTYTWYQGRRGDDYTETEYYTETNASGQQETKTRQVTKTRWTYVSGEVQHFFDDVLICGSRGLPEYHVAAVMPEKLQGLESFRHEFLSGFKTERYTIGPADGFARAREIMEAYIRQLCLRAIGGDHQELSSVETQHVGVTFEHILVPLWLTNYRYRNQTYRVLVNGRTGKVSGDRPYSWVKITLLVLLILAVLIGLILLFTGVFGAARAEAPKPHLHAVAQSVSGSSWWRNPFSPRTEEIDPGHDPNRSPLRVCRPLAAAGAGRADPGPRSGPGAMHALALGRDPDRTGPRGNLCPRWGMDPGGIAARLL